MIRMAAVKDLESVEFLKDRYCIYKHTTPDKRIYIGKAKGNPLKRWNKGNGYKDSWFWRCGIEVFGWDNITHEILEINIESNELAEIYETNLIIKHNSWVPGIGFNDVIYPNQHSRLLPIRNVDTHEVFPTKKLAQKRYGIKSLELRSYNTPFYTHGYHWEVCCAENLKKTDVYIAELYKGGVQDGSSKKDG